MTTCDGDCARCILAAEHHPHGPEWTMADGVFIKTLSIPKAFTVLTQHSHTFDHTTMIAKGSVDVEDDQGVRRFHAPASVFIKAGVNHRIQSLVDDTTVYCIHNVSRAGFVQVHDEHLRAKAL